MATRAQAPWAYHKEQIDTGVWPCTPLIAARSGRWPPRASRPGRRVLRTKSGVLDASGTYRRADWWCTYQRVDAGPPRQSVGGRGDRATPFGAHLHGILRGIFAVRFT